MKKLFKKLTKKTILVISHQKTALTDGFNVTVDSKPSIVPHTVYLLYHRKLKLSNFKIPPWSGRDLC